MIFIFKDKAASDIDTLKDILKSDLNDGVIVDISPSIHKKIESYFEGTTVEEIMLNSSEYGFALDDAGFTIIPSAVIRYAENGCSLSSPTRVYLLNDTVCVATSKSFKPLCEDKEND